MSEYIVSFPSWWNPIGNTVTKPEEKSGKAVTYTTKSGHLKIYVTKQGFLLQSITFYPGEIRCDFEALLSESEFATMFNVLPRANNATVPDYVLRFKGEVGVPGKFFRLGEFVNFPCPGTGITGDPNFSFLLKDYMTREVADVIQFPEKYMIDDGGALAV